MISLISVVVYLGMTLRGDSSCHSGADNGDASRDVWIRVAESSIINTSLGYAIRATSLISDSRLSAPTTRL
jgi:hypothetical protein